MFDMLSDIIIYGLCFATTLGFVYFAENELRRKKRMGFYVLSMFALFVPCLLAGLRADTVGTDVQVYAKPVFNAAAQRSFSEINDFYLSIEVGYRALALLVSRMTDDFGVFLALSQLAVILPVYIIAYKRRRITPMWVTMAIYLCLFYCASFNLMRQCISAALLLLAIQLFEEKKYFRTLICILIGMLFHGSILIGVAVFAISYLVARFKKASTQWILIILMSLSIVVLFSLWQQILSWAIDIGLLPEKYNTYLRIFSGSYSASQSYYFELTVSNYIEVAYRLLFALLGILYVRKAIRREIAKDVMMHVTVVIICALVESITMLILHSSYGLRIVWNNEFSLLMMLPALLNKKSFSLKKTSIRTIVVVLSVVSFFGLGYIILGWHGISPFRFCF